MYCMYRTVPCVLQIDAKHAANFGMGRDYSRGTGHARLTTPVEFIFRLRPQPKFSNPAHTIGRSAGFHKQPSVYLSHSRQDGRRKENQKVCSEELFSVAHICR